MFLKEVNNMPYKPGGGEHLQYYDEENGEYSEEKAKASAEKDKENLVLYYWYGMEYPNLTFHFPKFGIHDEEYCDTFVYFYRKNIEKITIELPKLKYLLTPDPKKDKSKFLMSLGYSLEQLVFLKNDIINGTEWDKLRFGKLTNFGITAKCKTVLKDKIVTTIWELDQDFNVRLITLIPGGDKKWNSK